MSEFENDDVRDISSPELGEILGISDIEVCRLARAGILPRIARERGRAFLYPLVACLKAYLKYRNSQSVKDREAYLREKARSEKARAQKLELENALRIGQQVNIEEVAREMREQHSAVRRRLLILPLWSAKKTGMIDHSRCGKREKFKPNTARADSHGAARSIRAWP